MKKLIFIIIIFIIIFIIIITIIIILLLLLLLLLLFRPTQMILYRYRYQMIKICNKNWRKRCTFISWYQHTRNIIITYFLQISISYACLSVKK